MSGSLSTWNQIIDADERVVSLHRARLKMRHEIEFESPLAYIFMFQDGKVVHQQAFADHAEALKSVELSEQDAHADS